MKIKLLAIVHTEGNHFAKVLSAICMVMQLHLCTYIRFGSLVSLSHAVKQRFSVTQVFIFPNILVAVLLHIIVKEFA